jgi:hypothetical protein
VIETQVTDMLERAASRITVAPPPVGQIRARARQGKRRRFRLLMASVSTIGVVISAGYVATTQGSRESENTAAGAPVSMPMKFWSSRYGVRVEARRTYPDDRVLRSPSATVGTLTSGASLWPLDGVDHEGEDLDPLRLPANTPVLVETWIKPDCGPHDESPEILLSVSSERTNGETVTERWTPSNPDAYVSAVRMWCKVGVTVQAGGGTITPRGVATLAITIVNGTKREVRVIIPATQRGDVTWSELRMSVPAGARVVRNIRGTGVRCGRGAAASWNDVRVVVDGKSLPASSITDWSC